MYNFFSNISRRIGFLDFGAAKAEFMPEEAERFRKYLDCGYCAGMDYLRKNLDKRFDPTKLMEKEGSVLVFLVPYSFQNFDFGIASYAYGEDYHRVIKDKLFLFMKEAGIEGRPFVDSAPILERAWAVRAGLGFIGKNKFLISPEYGLRVLIGIILTPIPFDKLNCKDLQIKKARVPHDCGMCGRCVSACPNGALCADGMLDSAKCISYHTIESKEMYEDKPVAYDGSFFGCDKCLNVCPWNKPGVVGWKEFEKNKARITGFSKEDWLSMTKDEFKNIFDGTPLARTGIEKLKNNINFA